MKDTMAQKSEVLTIRVTPSMALQLKREAGPHGSVSSVVRSVLEKVFKGKV
jgi:hypothetical protein